MTLKYEFRPKSESQRLVMEATESNVLYDGPWGCGKTHAGAAKAYMAGLLYPNNRVALVRKKRVDLKATLWKWFIDKVLPPGVVVQQNDTDLYRRIVNGTEFFGVGLDSDTDVNKLASREYGLIIVEEAREISESDFDEKISRCLRLPTVPFHQVLLLTNPDTPGHFLYKRFFVEKPEGYRRIQGTTLADLPTSYYLRLDQLKGIYRERYKEGKWTAFEGLVYPFDPMKHIIERFDIPPDWRRVEAIDFGFDHPFVYQRWAISPSDVWYMYKEIYHSRRTVKVHAKDIQKIRAQEREAITRIFDDDLVAGRIDKGRYDARLSECLSNVDTSIICDHDAEDRATLGENGLRTRPAKKDRLAGQQAVYDKFENDKMFFMRDSLYERDQRLIMEQKPIQTVDEFGTYTWATGTKEDMIKERDDGLDTTRYAVYTTGDAGESVGFFVVDLS